MRKNVEQLSPTHILPEISYAQAEESWIMTKHAGKLKQTKKNIKSNSGLHSKKSRENGNATDTKQIHESAAIYIFEKEEGIPFSNNNFEN